MKREQINEKLKKYIVDNILPMYSKHDPAHRLDHVLHVVTRTLKLVEIMDDKGIDLNINIAYAAAIYHDTGLMYGREDHNINSGKIVREDKNLKEFFSDDEIELIAQACEDHRASLKYEPRSIYGKIVSDADRDGDICIMIERSYNYYSMKNPKASAVMCAYHAFTHLGEKYGDKGYVKYHLEETYSLDKNDIKEILQSESRFIDTFNSMNFDKKLHYHDFEDIKPARHERV